ncbi:hypothetical protein [Flavobacterium gilvum]|uniref:DUF4296 domain-containing protein n=1 Tax=Flavobacterium gilvum TaxID=1492737 RepID=A0AAC9I8M2_9FLAO|nr:hypothetical protein [Flavobacterium gilvum]AOW11093.1 hypothetical protein EM308_17290 [Flavobacterium gilvum]KFC61017.1 hypothetical protein FEM08_01390 [Flavobacterium gilvum]
MEKITVIPLKKNLSLFFSLVFIMLAIANANSQTVKYDSVTKKKYILVDVQKTYERIANQGYGSLEVYEFLGNYYYENNNPKKSKLYFDKLFGNYSLSQISPKSKERYQVMSK